MRRKRLRAYLSGGMEYAKNEGGDWRKELNTWLKKDFDHSVFNPSAKSKEFLAKLKLQNRFRLMKETNIEDYISIVKKFVDIDSKEIATRSDYVVCYWDRSAQQGAGTKGELTLARYFNKPIFMITSISKKEIPGWVLGCVDHFFTSFDEFKIFFVKKYKKGVALHEKGH